jgi:hypothetical protein
VNQRAIETLFNDVIRRLDRLPANEADARWEPGAK